MARTLKQVYADAGRAADYFDDRTPPYDLWRAQTSDDFEKKVFFLQPSPGRPGREPDVRTEERGGKLWVLGCYSVDREGHFGVSTFDRQVELTKRHKVQYRIPGGTEITPNLAITRDSLNSRFNARHHTIAPKNDMPLELFLQSLKVVAAAAVKE